MTEVAQGLALLTFSQPQSHLASVAMSSMKGSVGYPIGVLVLLAAGVGGWWLFYLRRLTVATRKATVRRVLSRSGGPLSQGVFLLIFIGMSSLLFNNTPERSVWFWIVVAVAPFAVFGGALGSEEWFLTRAAHARGFPTSSALLRSPECPARIKRAAATARFFGLAATAATMWVVLNQILSS